MYSAGRSPRKTKPRGGHPDKRLTAGFVRSAGPGRYCDGQGLYLYVQSSGARSWVQRLVIHGRRHDIGLGSAQLVPLAEAREMALVNRKFARQGGDPLAEKRRMAAMPTFADAARRVLEQKRDGWREGRHAQSWWASLERYAFPRIGARPVCDVTGAEVLDVLTPIWHSKPPTARRGRERIRAVLEWAVARELRSDNPCDRIGSVLGPQRAAVEHMQALQHQDVAGAVAAVRASGGAEVVKLAFELLVLTVARWGEVRGAQWSEFDVAGRVWTVPAERMKANRAHRVPLCGRAMEILDAARLLGEGSGPLVFPGPRGAQLAEKGLRRLLQRLEIAAVPHGFRSTFRDWAAEETEHRREVIEAALAHVVRDKVEAAYARSDLFERRRRLMDDWSAYVNGAGRPAV
ncbi:MAG: integrase arm-type DNA-binding domain-containing protein [Acidobacteria bacterium]|nr:integrase arm-type DNA-binding domain-containing protein [Acidobacteriota bacterium]